MTKSQKPYLRVKEVIVDFLNIFILVHSAYSIEWQIWWPKKHFSTWKIHYERGPESSKIVHEKSLIWRKEGSKFEICILAFLVNFKWFICPNRKFSHLIITRRLMDWNWSSLVECLEECTLITLNKIVIFNVAYTSYCTLPKHSVNNVFENLNWVILETKSFSPYSMMVFEISSLTIKWLREFWESNVYNYYDHHQRIKIFSQIDWIIRK